MQFSCLTEALGLRHTLVLEDVVVLLKAGRKTHLKYSTGVAGVVRQCCLPKTHLKFCSSTRASSTWVAGVVTC